MKSINASIALTLLVTSAVAATECKKSNAKAWPTSGTEACMGNAECLAIVLDGQCNASGLADSENTKCVKQKRATLQCTSSEVCYLYTDGDLLCHNRSTGDYHDENGGRGNTNSGVYTYADGQVVTNPGTGSYTRPATTTKKDTSTRTGATTTASTTAGTSITSVVGAVTAGQTAIVSSVTTTTRATGAARLASSADEALLSLGGLALAVAAWV